MAEKKYGKNIISDSYVKASKDFNEATIFSYDNRDNAGATYEYHCINKADWAIKEAVSTITGNCFVFWEATPGIKRPGSESACAGG